MEGDEPQLQPVEPGYKNVLRVRIAITWLVLIGISLVINAVLLNETRFAGALPALFAALGLSGVAVAPQRIYQRLRYGLSERLLQVVRGWLFHRDTVVPLVRVQHLDVTRGPLDKMFGTATLVVHTAGTHNSIVTLPGLGPERAAEMRDAIREHVRTDFA
ncbi:PH domain-containing protein [Sphingomonas lutea]|uniref:PH domain-containing protein n=1 Tax=Sphingomonas lutea TaxID=1045317 RepID=A0A7G9SJZ8_9SPHN|nr:PH domain-containing protein [Sphingomonas lutea]QNN68173.1 PH domain-containing protein [Sphingomonas lutea]